MDQSSRKRVSKTIDLICENPYNPKFSNLITQYPKKRAKCGEYRILFFIEGNLVYISKVGHRKNIYD